MGQFKVRSGRHIEADGKEYQAGETVDSKLPLDAMFPGKFEVLKASTETTDEQERAPLPKGVKGAELTDDTEFVGTSVKDRAYTRKAVPGSNLNGEAVGQSAKAQDVDEDETPIDEIEYDAVDEESGGISPQSEASIRKKQLRGETLRTDDPRSARAKRREAKKAAKAGGKKASSRRKKAAATEDEGEEKASSSEE